MRRFTVALLCVVVLASCQGVRDHANVQAASNIITTTTVDPLAAVRADSQARNVALDAELVAGLTKADLVGLPSALGAWDKAVIYSNGCHTTWSSSTVFPCSFGDVKSSHTVVISGDSHAAHMQPALAKWAQMRNWRLISITKTGCPLVDVHVINAEETKLPLHLPYPECDAWRAKAIAKINTIRPDAVVLPLLSRRGLSEPGKLNAWQRGIKTTVRALAGLHVVVLGDDPQVGRDMPVCLRRSRDPRQCVIPWDQAVHPERLAAERDAAVAAGAKFHDISTWFCVPKKGCPAVAGSKVVRRDDNHLAAAFARHIWPRIDTVIGPLATP